MFESYVDLKNIVDSMQLDSETEICRYLSDDGRFKVTVEVRGEVRVDWNPNGITSTEETDTYTIPSEFPKDLKDLIAHGNDVTKGVWWTNDPRVYILENNWFELFIWAHENGSDDYLTSDLVDVEGMSGDELRELCEESLIEYQKWLRESPERS